MTDSDYGHVVLLDEDKDFEPAYIFKHAGGRECVRTDRGFWLKRGMGPDAVCIEDHSSLPVTDPVAMPSHYTRLPVECIDVTEHFGFCLGNAIKYIWRADHKGKPVEDLRKAIWYLEREVARREKG